MISRGTLTLFGILLSILSVLVASLSAAQESVAESASRSAFHSAFPWASPCARIVSLAPSLDEVLFTLGLSEHLVGVTQFSRYPEAAKSIPRVGGFLDVNREAVLALRPTLVIALDEMSEAAQSLRNLGLSVEIVTHKTVSGILKSISDIATICRIPERGEEAVRNLQSSVERIGKVTRVPPLRVLVAVGDDSGEGPHRSVYVSGSDGYYSELLHLLGAENVHAGLTMSVPTLSAEGLVALDPDVVLVVSSKILDAQERQRVISAWHQVPGLRIATHKTVYVLDQDFMTIPGPRYVEALGQISEVLHAALAALDRKA